MKKYDRIHKREDQRYCQYTLFGLMATFMETQIFLFGATNELAGLSSIVILAKILNFIDQVQ